MMITSADTLKLAEGASLSLILNDGTIAEYKGPSEITSISATKNQEPSILGKIGAALRTIFLAKDMKKDEATLGVRDATTMQSMPLRVPQMLYPPSGIILMSPPTQFRWQPIEGVIFYTVSLYGRNKLVWDGRTNASFIDIPKADSILEPGQDYLWVVLAEIGDNNLSSKQSTFSVLNESEALQIGEYLDQIDAEVQEERVRHYLKAELYRDHGLTLECYDEISAILKDSPDEYSALIMQANLLEEMTYYKAANNIYKILLDQ